jgi:uncharacterized protein (DUF2164 family)
MTEVWILHIIENPEQNKKAVIKKLRKYLYDEFGVEITAIKTMVI